MIQIWQVPSECGPSNLVVLGQITVEIHTVHTAFWRIVWLHDDFHVNLTEFFFVQIISVMSIAKFPILETR